MRSSALFFSNLYSTAFLGTLIHWVVEFFVCGIDFFGYIYNMVYTTFMRAPVLSFSTSIINLNNSYIDRYNSGLYWFYYEGWLAVDKTYVVIMIMALFLCTIGVVVGWTAFARKSSGLALVSAIIFLLVSLCTPIASLFTLPLVAFSFLGYGMQKNLK